MILKGPISGFRFVFIKNELTHLYLYTYSFLFIYTMCIYSYKYVVISSCFGFTISKADDVADEHSNFIRDNLRFMVISQTRGQLK